MLQTNQYGLMFKYIDLPEYAILQIISTVYIAIRDDLQLIYC